MILLIFRRFYFVIIIKKCVCATIQPAALLYR